MRITQSIVRSNMFFLGVLFFTLIIPILPNNFVKFNLSLYLLFSTISSLSLVSMFYIDKTTFSINKTFHVFFFFFFGLSPLLQYQNEIVFYEANLLSHSAYFKAGIFVLLAQIIYVILYSFLGKKTSRVKTYYFDLSEKPNHFRVLLLSMVAFLGFLYLINFDFKLLYQSPTGGWRKDSVKHGLIGFSIFLIVRVITVICFLYYSILKKTNVKTSVQLILFILFCLTCFPTSLPRSQVATFYLPVLIIVFSKYITRTIYLGIYFISFFLLFPLFNYFRNGLNTIDLGTKLLLSPHLDAFNNWAAILQNNIVTNGKQLLGNILFFVPESLWMNKAKPTGELLAVYTNQSYSNVAIPLFAEGYVNFGVFGFFLFVIGIAFLNYFLDFRVDKSKVSIASLVFFLFIGFEFYLLRGDLYSSFKYMYSFFIALFVLWTVIHFRIKRI